MITVYDVIRRPLVTEKGVTKKDSERTLCFEVNVDANKTQIKQAVEAGNKAVAQARTAAKKSAEMAKQGLEQLKASAPQAAKPARRRA